jgi:hypothetical protein
MRKTTLLLALGAGALAVLLSSCTNGGEEPTTSTTAVPVTSPALPVLVSDTKDSSNCIACHTDQESLVALAVEPVEETLNEGEG